jgi:hypothetical protein
MLFRLIYRLTGLRRDWCWFGNHGYWDRGRAFMLSTCPKHYDAWVAEDDGWLN